MAKTGRKRENKSSKGREKKRLREKFTKTSPSSPSSSLASSSSHLYDRVLVDAECSHDGSYRHISAMAIKANAMDIYHATDRDIHMTTLQTKLLQNGFNLLQRNGVLIYSTCRSLIMKEIKCSFYYKYFYNLLSICILLLHLSLFIHRNEDVFFPQFKA